MLFLAMLFIQVTCHNSCLVFSAKSDVNRVRGFVDVSADMTDNGWKVRMTYFNRKAYDAGKKDCFSIVHLQGFYTLQEVLEIAKANCKRW